LERRASACYPVVTHAFGNMVKGALAVLQIPHAAGPLSLISRRVAKTQGPGAQGAISAVRAPRSIE
jgi:hypothetical protein